MPPWKSIEKLEPEFCERVRRLFDADRHKTIATLRADGSPRVSGIECEFSDGELRFGSVPELPAQHSNRQTFVTHLSG